MTERRRIVLNIVATYGRSLFALVCGIFTSRWLLMSLGQVDYGLYGVIGGLAAFITFFNGLLATSVARFYAVSVGRSRSNQAQGLIECRQWFSIAVMIHTLVPMVLIAVGYPAGIWAIRNFLTIPPERVVACVWVFRFLCVSCFIAMVNVPYTAMYTAKQYIAELTVYSFASTIANVALLYYMVTHPSVWLARYAGWTCLISVLPQVIICVRARMIFPECHFVWRSCIEGRQILKLLNFAWWQLFGCLGSMLRNQGMAILVNKYFGPRVNAAMSVSNTVSAQASTLSGAMQGAFSPAIMTAYGEGNMERMRSMSFRACKFGVLLVLIFILPLAIEMEEVMTLWLKNPPEYAAGLCLFMLALPVLDKISIGHMIAVCATGKIALYQAVLGGALLLTLPLAWVALAYGAGVYAIGWTMLATMLVCSVGRVWFARSLVGMSSVYWVRRIVMPLAIIIIASLAFGYLPSLFWTPSFWRVCATTLCVEVVLLPMSWFFALDAEEKTLVAEKFKRMIHRA